MIMPVAGSRACTERHVADWTLDYPAHRYCNFRTVLLSDGCASRVGLTPSPTCLPGQGGSRKGMRPFGNETGRANRQPSSGQTDGGCFYFMSHTSKRLPDESETPFVDPWSEKPSHQGEVPADALFIGAWENDLGIFSLS